MAEQNAQLKNLVKDLNSANADLRLRLDLKQSSGNSNSLDSSFKKSNLNVSKVSASKDNSFNINSIDSIQNNYIPNNQNANSSSYLNQESSSSNSMLPGKSSQLEKFNELDPQFNNVGNNYFHQASSFNKPKEGLNRAEVSSQDLVIETDETPHIDVEKSLKPTIVSPTRLFKPYWKSKTPEVVPERTRFNKAPVTIYSKNKLKRNRLRIRFAESESNSLQNSSKNLNEPYDKSYKPSGSSHSIGSVARVFNIYIFIF